MSTHPLGQLVHQYADGRDHLAIFEHGFQTEGTMAIAARWEDVVYVMRYARRVVVNGFPLDNATLEIGLASGARYLLEKRDLNLHPASNLIAELALPHLLKRMDEDFRRGTGAVISTRVSVSPQGFHVQERGVWRLIPADQIAGYRIVRGYCMIDTDPARPRLSVNEHVGNFVNAVAIEQLLDRVAPGKDLNKVRYSVNVPFWSTSAASHVPDSMLRMKLMVIGGILAFALPLAGIFAWYVSSPSRFRYDGGTQAFEKALAAIAPLPTPAATLRDACAAKAIDPETMVLGFVGPKDTKHDFNIFFGGVWLRHEGTQLSSELTRKERIAVAKLLDGATLDEKGLSHARAHVRITELDTGALVCEGTTEGHWTLKKGEDSYHGKTYGFTRLVIAGLCTGKTYRACTDSFYHIEWGDGPPPAPAATASASASAPAKGKGVKAPAKR